VAAESGCECIGDFNISGRARLHSAFGDIGDESLGMKTDPAFQDLVNLMVALAIGVAFYWYRYRPTRFEGHVA